MGQSSLRTIIFLRVLALRRYPRRVAKYLFLAYVCFCLYKMLKRLLKPDRVSLFLRDSPRNQRLLAACPSLFKYKPTPWMMNGHLQTLFAAAFRPQPGSVKYTRTFVDMSDGGHVALDWVEPFELGQPTLLLLHGLTGGSDESYVQWSIHAAKQRGLQCVVMNARGCGGSGLATPRSFSAAQTEDLGLVVRDVREFIGPSPPLFAIGYSLGAGILAKYLGERGRRCGIAAAVACCASYDMRLSTRHMESFPNKYIYNRHLTGNLIRWVRKHDHIFSQASWADLKALYSARTVREFDNVAIVPQYGYEDVWAYYDDASSGRLLPGVEVPFLIANAKDDPIAHWSGIPLDAVGPGGNGKVIIALTEEGGHVAWCEGWWPTRESWDNRIAVEFFEACMKDLDFIGEQPAETFAPLGASPAQRAAAAAGLGGGGGGGPFERDWEDPDDRDDGPLFF